MLSSILFLECSFFTESPKEERLATLEECHSGEASLETQLEIWRCDSLFLEEFIDDSEWLGERPEVELNSSWFTWASNDSYGRLYLNDTEQTQWVKISPKIINVGTKLTNLSIGDSPNLVHFPAEVWSLPSLRGLAIGGDLNMDIYPSVDTILGKPNFEHLDLSYNIKLKEFPEGFEHFQKLSQLYMTGTSITYISPAVFKLPNLTFARFGEVLPGVIDSLPENLNEAKSLTSLSIPNNNLRHIPESICELPNLERLKISGNRICEGFPSCLTVENGYSTEYQNCN